jgi:sugar O-acyltransferase (sialic acid O-acetyltransferase NeuD family)
MHQGEWRIAGFLDANPQALEGKNYPYKILGDPATWMPADDEIFIAGIGDPESRLRSCLDLKSRGARFLTVIHPSAVLAANVEIGEGCVIAPNAVISADAKLERFVSVNIAASIGHDTQTGEGTTVSSHSDLMGAVSVGRCCFIGSHACILPAKKVGDYAIVGAGSAVVRNVPSRTTVMGVPAQILAGSSV